MQDWIRLLWVAILEDIYGQLKRWILGQCPSFFIIPSKAPYTHHLKGLLDLTPRIQHRLRWWVLDGVQQYGQNEPHFYNQAGRFSYVFNNHQFTVAGKVKGYSRFSFPGCDSLATGGPWWSLRGFLLRRCRPIRTNVCRCPSWCLPRR